MDDIRIQRAVTALLAARRRGTPSPAPAFSADAAPHTEAQAYRVQREVGKQLGTAIGGWKISMDDEQVGRYAPIFAHDLHASPARVAGVAAPENPSVSGRSLGVEPEIAFRLGVDLPLPAPGRPYTRGEIIAAIGSAHAAIEIVVSRFASHAGAPILDQLADNLSNHGFVAGPALTRWQSLSIAALPLQLWIGERRAHTGVGGHPIGDPLLPLIWLVNHIQPADGALLAGHYITTGSCAGLHDAASGARVRAEFGGLGAAVLEVI